MPKSAPPTQAHVLYVMRSVQRPPAGDGDITSWFRFYKWNVEGETMIPHRFPFLPVAAGSYIWFVMDGQLLGGALVTRVENPPLPMQMQEIWYNASAMLEFTPPLELLGDVLPPVLVLDSVAADWLKTAVSRNVQKPAVEEPKTP